jgi:hypothetical protein
MWSAVAGGSAYGGAANAGGGCDGNGGSSCAGTAGGPVCRPLLLVVSLAGGVNCKVVGGPAGPSAVVITKGKPNEVQVVSAMTIW